MPLDDCDQLPHFFVLFLNFLPQCLVVLEKVLILLVKRLELSCSFVEIEFKALFCFLQISFRLFQLLFIFFDGLLYLCLHVLDFFFFQLVHLFREIHLFICHIQLFLHFLKLGSKLLLHIIDL